MPCEIVHQVTRPDGPYGQPVIRSTCAAHGFSQYGVKLEAICPIGLIYEARDRAMAEINALGVPPVMAGMGTDDGEMVPVDPNLPLPPSPPVKRTRKPKAEPDA